MSTNIEAENAKRDKEEQSETFWFIFAAVAFTLLVYWGGYESGKMIEQEEWKREVIARGYASYYILWKPQYKKPRINWKWNSDETGIGQP